MQPQPSFPIHNVSIRTGRSEPEEEVYANDNEPDYANDNEYSGPPTDIASEFANRYESLGLQPSVGSRPTIEYKKSVPRNIKSKPNRTKTRGASKGMQTVGRAVSRTGVGAAVGVPLMAAGKAMERERRVPSRMSSRVNFSPTKIKQSVTAKRTVSRLNITILSVGMALWIWQFYLALAALGLLGLAGGAEAAVTYLLGDTVASFMGGVVNAVTGAIEYVTGYDLNPITAWRNASTAMVIAVNSLAFFIGIITLLGMTLVYTLSGIKPFWGEGATVKIATFIFALFGYFFPIFNLFPWFILWGIAVWWYPK